MNLQDIEKLTEDELKELYEVLRANLPDLLPKEKLELFWISVKLLDLDEENRKKMFYEFLDLGEYDFVEDYE